MHQDVTVLESVEEALPMIRHILQLLSDPPNSFVYVMRMNESLRYCICSPAEDPD